MLLGIENSWGPIKSCVQQNFVSEKVLTPKKIGPQKNLAPKIYCSKKICFQEMLRKKVFGLKSENKCHQDKSCLHNILDNTTFGNFDLLPNFRFHPYVKVMKQAGAELGQAQLKLGLDLN